MVKLLLCRCAGKSTGSTWFWWKWSCITVRLFDHTVKTLVPVCVAVEHVQHIPLNWCTLIMYWPRVKIAQCVSGPQPWCHMQFPLNEFLCPYMQLAYSSEVHSATTEEHRSHYTGHIVFTMLRFVSMITLMQLLCTQYSMSTHSQCRELESTQCWWGAPITNRLLLLDQGRRQV